MRIWQILPIKGKVCIRSSSNIYNISLMASIVARDGEAAAEEWAAGVVANFAPTPVTIRARFALLRAVNAVLPLQTPTT